jgi:hypothetical protein
MFPPADGQRRTFALPGRSYSAVPGQFLDVPDFDANVLEGNGWARVEEVGSTPARPNPAATTIGAVNSAGRRYFDTTLGLMIVWDGAVWRNPATGAAV